MAINDVGSRIGNPVNKMGEAYISILGSSS